MQPSLFAAGWVTLGIALAVAGLSSVVGWVWGAARARAAGNRELREAEKRASAEAARAETLAQQALAAEARANGIEVAFRHAENDKAAANARATELQRSLAEQRALLDDAKAQMSDTFQALAAEALQNSHEGFLAIAGERLGALRQESAADLETRRAAIEASMQPVRESLAKVDEQLREIERERGKAYGALSAEVRAMSATQEKLRAETGNLVSALRAPAVRGRWGELQLRRVVEMAGMLAHCDFEEQASVTTEDGRLRPDMVVRLPSGRNIVIDAKTPLGAYLEAQDTTTIEDRTAKLRHHAMQVRSHVSKLSAKAYWDQFDVKPEVVVMFLPGEAFYSVALEQMPGLIEEGFAQNVLVATPTTLLGLLRAVSAGWREERIAENAQRISEEGRKVHERIATLADHFAQMGRALGSAVGSYNQAMASFDTRLVPAARSLAALHAGSKKDLVEIDQIDKRPRSPQRPEARAIARAPLTLALSPANLTSDGDAP
ncbi:MAG TPA: DNA recombination protein RmuC [Polyangia bacterium]|nr:DNA recombination protein RmuC [Polyangia bacterium]